MLYVVTAVALSLASIQVDVDTVDGRTQSGALLEWTPDRLVLDTPAGRQECVLAEVLAVRPQVVSAPAMEIPAVRVELVDGSTLIASRYTVHAGDAALVLEGGQSISLPVGTVAAVHFREPAESLARSWSEIRRKQPAADLLVIRKGESLDYLEGLLGDVSEHAVQFEIDGKIIPAPRGKVEGLVYYRRSDTQLAESLCTVVGPSGMNLRVSGVSLAGDKFRVVGLTGVVWELGAASVSRFDFSSGKVVYLSDLEPELVEWTPFFEFPRDAESLVEFGSPRRDAALEGGPLKLDGKTIAKGLALRSRSRMTYRLPAKFREFSAVAGIDDRMGDHGHVRLVVRGDERDLFDKIITGRDAALAVRVGIEDVKRLTIVVDYGDDQDLADHLDLGDAKISK